MKTKIKIIIELLIFLAAIMPAAFAASISGGPEAWATGSGYSGGGSYQITYAPSATEMGVEAGVSAWATAMSTGTGSASASFTGSPTITNSIDSSPTATYTDTLTATIKNAKVTAAVDKTTSTGTSAAFAAITTRAVGHPNQGDSVSSPTIEGNATIQTKIGPFKTSLLSPQDPMGPSATQGGDNEFNGGGTASATVSGQALFDASQVFKGTTTEVLKVYGQIGSDSSAANADMYGSRSDASASTGKTTGSSYITVNSQANNKFTRVQAEKKVDLDALGDNAGANDILAKINGSVKSTTAVVGAWDDLVSASTTKIKNSNEVSYASAMGNVFNSASSFKADATAPDEGRAQAQILANTAEIHSGSDYWAESLAAITAVSSAQRMDGLSSNNLVSGIANIDDAITDAKVQTSSTTYSQIHAETGTQANGFGFNGGSQLNHGDAGTGNRVYAGQQFKATSNLFTTGTEMNPRIQTQFGTFTDVGDYATCQGANPGTSWSSYDGAGSWAMVGNFFAKAVAPSITGSPFSTNAAHLYNIGWAQGADPSTQMGAWIDGLTFTGTADSNHPSGKILENYDRTDQTGRLYDHYIKTDNSWATSSNPSQISTPNSSNDYSV